MLGDTSQIEKKQQEAFRISNLAHILAVSGMHISYLVLGVNGILLKFIGKNTTRIISIFILIMYLFITNFSPSVIRAVVMVIFINISKLIHRKNDTINTLSFSLFIILCDNPYAIMNIGLQFSYIGTIGILFFNSVLSNLLKCNDEENVKKFSLVIKLKKIIATILSAQIVLLPISIFHFNSLGIYSIFTNICISMLIGPVIILGFISIIISFIFFPFSQMLVIFLKLGLKGILAISNMSNLPFSNIYVPTPKVWMIILYYIVLFFIRQVYLLYQEKSPNMTQIRVKNIIAMFELHFRENIKKYRIIFILSLLLIIVFFCVPQELKIHFIDVGQGDSTFIETPFHQTILIDGGGSESTSFDVGKNMLLPYLFDKGYTKIDYIFISHFDQDHVRSDY